MMTKGMPDFNQKEDDYWQTLPGTMGNIRPVSEFIKKHLATAIEVGKTVVTEKKVEEKKKEGVYVPSIQERLRTASMAMTVDLDEVLEKPMDELDIKDFSPLKILRQKQAKANHAKIIKEFYNDDMIELEEVVNKVPSSIKSKWTERDWHDQLIEAYAIYDTKVIKTKHKALKQVVDACDMLIAEGKLNRKPRKVKPKSAEKLVAKMKYKQQDEKTALVSINPADIRFDEKESIAKTLRKPVEQLAEFKKWGKIQRKKFFEGIKTTETKLNGRVNPDTILLLTT